MRNAPPGTPTTWMGHKDKGKSHFQAEEYEQALESYRAALSPQFSCPNAERQILLSNVVACRLKIGGAAQAAAAVEEAKQCIALNDSWSKGHVRLASAYVALGDHSNDACNALQRALSLDPGNTQARQMLMRELRRDHISARQSSETQSSSGTSTTTPAPTAPPEQDILDEPTLEDSLSWSDRVKFYYMQAVSWYHSQSDDRKNLMKVGLVILALYVAFGGRFGLDQVLSSNRHENRGNYEAGNAYDRYNNRQGSYGNPNSYSSSHHQSSSQHHRQTSYASEYEYRPRRQSSSNSFHFPNLFDGSPQSMLCLAGIAYLCYRNGVNPFQVIMMLNMMNGHRRGGMGMRRRGFGMGGMGYGGGMMGGGFGGQRGFQRNRWR